jgi:hypothetical protein
MKEETKEEIKFMGIRLLSNISSEIIRGMSRGLILGNNDPKEIIETIQEMIEKHKLEVSAFLEMESKDDTRL